MELQRCLVNYYSFSGGNLPVSDFTVYSYHETLHIMHNLDPRRKLIHRKLSRTAKISLNGEKQPQRGQSWWNSQRTLRSYHGYSSSQSSGTTSWPGSEDFKWHYISKSNKRYGRREGCCICNSLQHHGHMWSFHTKRPHTSTSQFFFILIVLLWPMSKSPLAVLCGADICDGWYQADPGCVQRRSSCAASALGLHPRTVIGSAVPHTGIGGQCSPGWCTGCYTQFDGSAHTHYSRYTYL